MKIQRFGKRRSLALTLVVVTVGLVVPGLAVGSHAAPESAARATARCATSGLVVWLNTNGDGAAGSSYFKLEFTNQSGHSCTLSGYPGVSGVDLHGHQLGSAGSRNPAAVHVRTLANGATATATLRIVQAANFPNTICHRVSAAGVRVYPPGQTAAKVVPFPFDACSRRGPGYLSVGPIT